MNNQLAHYGIMADLFYYPREGFHARIEKGLSFVKEYLPEFAPEMEAYASYVRQTDLEAIQELYTRSFDVQSLTTLDVGFVLFGDDYKRGSLLVNLNREHAEAGNKCHNELADHLPNLLNLLYKMDDEVIAAEMVEKILLPALKKIIREFEPERIEKKNQVYMRHMKTIIETANQHATVFQKPLIVLYEMLKKDFDTVEYVPPQISSDFLGAIGKEIELEPLK